MLTEFVYSADALPGSVLVTKAGCTVTNLRLSRIRLDHKYFT